MNEVVISIIGMKFSSLQELLNIRTFIMFISCKVYMSFLLVSWMVCGETFHNFLIQFVVTRRLFEREPKK